MKTIATVLIPTFNHGPTISFALASALSQTIKEIEVFVVGDGVPDITREIVQGIMKRDSRVKFFDNPKGPRHGEIYRHIALQEAQGEIVCYLSDDDLWLPHHVETMYKLLQQTNFANTLPVRLSKPNTPLKMMAVNLAWPCYRALLLDGKNRMPLSFVGHTTKFYHQLPYGWRTTPQGIATDLYMWQQFLTHPKCRAGSGSLPTGINFPTYDRPNSAQRIEELKQWWQQVNRPEFYSKLFSEVLASTLDCAIYWESRALIKEYPGTEVKV